MNKRQFEGILKSGEGAMVEFKKNVTSGLGREIAAFANTAGGRIFIGIDDKNGVRGCELTNQVKSRVQDIANNCDPRVAIKIKPYKYKDKKVIVITVPESADKPIQCSEGFFLREGANSQKMTRNEIFYWAQKTRKIRYESQLREDFKYPRDFNEKAFAELMEKMDITVTGQREDLLQNLGLGENGKNFTINNAGIMLFGKKRDLYIRQVYVTCVLYKGKNKVKIIDRKDFRDNLVQDYDNAFKFLQQHLRLEYVIEGGRPRKEIPEIPYDALKEALLNAIIHRDYFEIGARVMVEIFDDRVEISNPGEVLVEEKEFGKKTVSVARNPILFDIFHRLQLIEKVGTGIQRILASIQSRKLDIQFFFGSFFSITFFRPELPWVQKTKEDIEYTGQAADENRTSCEKKPDKLAKTAIEEIEEHITHTGQADNKNRTSCEEKPDKLAKAVIKEAEEHIAHTGQAVDENRTSFKKPDKLRKILEFCSSAKYLKEIMDHMSLKHRETFINNYLNPLLNEDFLAYTMPDKPKSPNQQYVITGKGKKILKKSPDIFKPTSLYTDRQKEHKAEQVGIEPTGVSPRSPASTLQALNKWGWTWDKFNKFVLSLSQVCPKSVPCDIAALILISVQEEINIPDLMNIMNKTNRTRFRKHFLDPLIEAGLIDFTIPGKPRSSQQKYVITGKGKKLLKSPGIFKRASLDKDHPKEYKAEPHKYPASTRQVLNKFDWTWDKFNEFVLSLSHVCPKSVPCDIAALILISVQEEINIPDLMNIVNKTNRTRFRKHFLNPLIEADLIDFTIPGKPRSSQQKYIITGKGKKILASIPFEKK